MYQRQVEKLCETAVGFIKEVAFVHVGSNLESRDGYREHGGRYLLGDPKTLLSAACHRGRPASTVTQACWLWLIKKLEGQVAATGAWDSIL